ncbi:hypothetical protein GCM10009665_39120 [Kitasatospora nipponensis]|uniref:MalT-like TPR region domain-containing protein n=1 Tax=Kitasatospora nipponensis TaxID=258049 RepID=A0ABN1WCF4_9ACTN
MRRQDGESDQPVGEEWLLELRVDTAFAELALRNGEDLQALAVLDRVLAADPPPDDATRYRAKAQRAWAVEKLGRLEEATGAYQRLLADPATEVGSAQWALLAVALCRCYRDVGDLAMSVDFGERALRELAASGAAAIHEHVQLGSTLMGCYINRGDLVSAKLLADRLAPLVRDCGSPVARGAVEWNSSIVAQQQGRLQEALEQAERALALMDEADNARHQGMLRYNLAALLLAHGELEQAHALLLTAYAILTDSGRVAEVIDCVFHLAEIHVQRGDPQAALEWADRGRQLLEQAGRELWCERAVVAMVAGRAHLVAGSDQLSEVELRSCGLLLSRAGEYRSVARLWRQLGDCWAERGEPVEAMTAYQVALGLLGTPRAAPLPRRRPAHS